MAAAAGTGPFLDKISKELLSCTICHKRYRKPKILPCLHTFCQDCLVTFVADGKLHCKTCQNLWDLPEGGVPNLKGNSFMQNLLDLLTLTEQLEMRQICEICKMRFRTVTYKCIDCEQFLCKECKGNHEQFPKLSTHKILSLEECKSLKDTNPVALLPREHCDIHPENVLKFYCERQACRVPVCMECTVVKHKQPDHTHI
ncbi:E3 ubiquitin-protein ligase TRIM56-like [Glandiceps talaboti]